MAKTSALAVLFAIASLPAAAQPEGPRTDILSTSRAGNVTATGQTKPPSRDASPASRLDLNRRSRSDDRQDDISRSICIGCSPR